VAPGTQFWRAEGMSPDALTAAFFPNVAAGQRSVIDPAAFTHLGTSGAGNVTGDLRPGGHPAVLRVLVVSSEGGQARMLAEWPWERSAGTTPFSGVAMTASLLPTLDGPGRYSQGKSLVQLVGHWLGLLDVAHKPSNESDGCASHLPGDYVADTPQQAFTNTLACQVRHKARLAGCTAD
jgi:hypothetical protein